LVDGGPCIRWPHQSPRFAANIFFKRSVNRVRAVFRVGTDLQGDACP
jgi:hypothetical protein